MSWEVFGRGEITGFVQISAQLFTNCVTLGRFCAFSKSAFSCLWFCIKPLPFPSPNIFPCEEPGCHSFPGIPRPLLSLVFSSFSQRAFPLPVFPQITPETFLFPQSSSSSPLSGTSSSTTVLSANAVTRSQVKGFIVGVRTWSGIGSPHFS